MPHASRNLLQVYRFRPRLAVKATNDEWNISMVTVQRLLPLVLFFPRSLLTCPRAHNPPRLRVQGKRERDELATLPLKLVLYHSLVSRPNGFDLRTTASRNTKETVRNTIIWRLDVARRQFCTPTRVFRPRRVR